MRLYAVLGLMVACTSTKDDTGPDPSTAIDSDDDGFTARYDCNDADATIHPGADELCDGVDNDCDDRVDEDALGAPTWYVDQDQDGWGDPDRDSEAQVACSAPVDRHYASVVGDCDDADAGVNPDAMEVCGDRIDNDCDGEESEEDDNTDPDSLGVWYLDLDGDGFGSDSNTVEGCTRPDIVSDTGDTGDSSSVEWASQPGDCDDADPLAYPGAGWREDDPVVAAACVRDADLDGYGDSTAESPLTAGTDCNDDADWIFLSSRDELEICDGADSNCNGGPHETEADNDEDGYVGCDPAIEGVWLGTEVILGGGDCDDNDSTKSPAADEVCNGVDDDCDGIADEPDDAVDQTDWFIDLDEDGYGDASVSLTECNQPTGYVAVPSDCDDDNPDINPGEYELCSTVGVDDDCDLSVDEDDALDTTTWYEDSDEDGYGSGLSSQDSCLQPSGYVELSTDCNDTNAAVNPGATEICNHSDDDCDGDVDGDDPSVVGDEWYYDQDGDGYGNPSAITRSCTQPLGYVVDDQDCDDGAADVNPDAVEICRDESDNDCNDSADQCDLLMERTLEDMDAVFSGDSASLGVGRSVIGLPDINGDGVRDILVGMPGDDTNDTDAGAAWFTYGPATGAEDASAADAIYSGVTASYQVGSALVGGTSLAGGAETDIGIGACPDSSNAVDTRGSVHVFFDLTVASSLSTDNADLELLGPTYTSEFGCTLSIGGDQDGDSADDLLVGSPGTSSSAGGVWIVSGPLSTTTTVYDDAVILQGVTAGDDAGISLSGNFDVDGDGTMDILMGAPGASATAGRAYLALGPVSNSVSLSGVGIGLVGQTTLDAAGTGVAMADLNDDGYADIVVGAPGDDDAGTDAGAAYIVYGPITQDLTLGLAEAKLTGGTPLALAGQAVANGGDLDTDGIDDLVIGAPGQTVDGVEAGAVYLLMGGTALSGTIDLTTEVNGVYAGSSVGDEAGAGLFGLGDISGDGWDDLAVGAPGVDGTATDQGAAYFIWGNGY